MMPHAERPALSLRHLTKHYAVYTSPADMLAELFTGRPRHRLVQAVTDISLDIPRGQCVGIVGRNGAGKSTLLKLITGTLGATAGSVEVAGKVAAILELGTGFNPQRTARENVYVCGICLGMTRREVDAAYADIVAFAELGEVMDQPLKTFSTGMAARLAFAVATAVRAEVLIVDEALSVGDVKFQNKCFNRFKELRAAGVTILFVTHSPQLVELICDRAIYLEAGRIKADGTPKEVVEQFMEDLCGPGSGGGGAAAAAPVAERRYGTGGVRILEVAMLGADGAPATQVASGAPARFRVRAVVEQLEPVANLNIGFNIAIKQGVPVFAISPLVAGLRIPVLQPGEEVEVTIDCTMNLGPGDYFVTSGAWAVDQEHHYDRVVDALHIRVTGPLILSQSLVNMAPRYAVQVRPAAALPAEPG